MAGGDELRENSNPLLGLAFDGTTWWNEIYVLEAELTMDASKTVEEWEYWDLTWLHAS